jgi:hypothetical protein
MSLISAGSISLDSTFNARQTCHDLFFKYQVYLSGSIIVINLKPILSVVTEPALCEILCTVKKTLAVFTSPAGMSLTEPSLDGNNLIFPVQGEFGK